MRKHLLLSFVPLAIAVAAAGPPTAARADEGTPADRAMLLAANAPGIQHGNGFGIVTVAAPRSPPGGRTSVTLWDEIPPPQLPVPLPAPQPDDVQHAMEGTAQGRTHQ
ncbi:hypothetical protein [Burkholderia metallica]|uniref:hypothetical protein n=1 Tax=Burkholderia metallica TaxID=488729 RepID=UPI001CF145D5|nr:hypothetical protein [Burkholderia metallica]MCA8018270.1 hypothetical protein [Burkholderia metallica]